MMAVTVALPLTDRGTAVRDPAAALLTWRPTTAIQGHGKLVK